MDKDGNNRYLQGSHGCLATYINDANHGPFADCENIVANVIVEEQLHFGFNDHRYFSVKAVMDQRESGWVPYFDYGDEFWGSDAESQDGEAAPRSLLSVQCQRDQERKDFEEEIKEHKRQIKENKKKDKNLKRTMARKTLSKNYQRLSEIL